MKFTMHRNHIVNSTLGHALRFEKGVPLEVPPALYPEVIAAGGIPEEHVDDEPVARKAEPTDPEEREALLVAAIAELVERGAREDFTASGTPSPKALAAKVGFQARTTERDAAFRRFLREKEEAEAAAKAEGKGA